MLKLQNNGPAEMRGFSAPRPGGSRLLVLGSLVIGLTLALAAVLTVVISAGV